MQSSKKTNRQYRKTRIEKSMWAGRLAWLGHLLDVQKVAGPNPVRPTPYLYESTYQVYSSH